MTVLTLWLLPRGMFVSENSVKTGFYLIENADVLFSLVLWPLSHLKGMVDVAFLTWECLAFCIQVLDPAFSFQVPVPAVVHEPP